LNKWLGDLIGQPDTLEFSVHYDLDPAPTVISLVDLALQPIDLIFLIGNQASGIQGEEQINDLTELEARIDFAFRTRRRSDDPNWDPSGQVTIKFMSRDDFSDSQVRTLFELLPLLRDLRKLVTSSRPLGADDYMLPSEEKADPNTADNPKLWELAVLEQSFDAAAASLDQSLQDLEGIIATFPPDPLSKNPGDLSGIDYDALRSALIALSYFGLTGAFPKNALLPEPGPDATDEDRLALLRTQQALIEQALLTRAQGRSRHARALALRTFSDLSPEEISRLTVSKKAEIYQAAGALPSGVGSCA
jgi:hypothetical protein